MPSAADCTVTEGPLHLAFLCEELWRELRTRFPPDQFLGDHSSSDGHPRRYFVNHPSQPLSMIVNPESPRIRVDKVDAALSRDGPHIRVDKVDAALSQDGPHIRVDEVEVAVSEAITCLSKVNTTQVEETTINSEQEYPTVASVTRQLLRFLESSNVCREASSHLDRLHENFTRHINAGSGELVGYEALVEAVEEFVGEGNPFKATEAQVSKGNYLGQDDQVLANINRLKVKYNRAIQLKRMTVTVIMGFLVVGSLILCITLPALATTFGAVAAMVTAFGTTAAWEMSRKAGEEDMKEKENVITKARGLLCSCKETRENHGLVSTNYEDFVQFIKGMGDKIQLAPLDKAEGKEYHLMIMRKEAKVVAERAKELKAEVDELEKNMDRVKILLKEIVADPSLNEVAEDIDREEPKQGGFFQKLFGCLCA